MDRQMHGQRDGGKPLMLKKHGDDNICTELLIDYYFPYLSKTATHAVRTQ